MSTPPAQPENAPADDVRGETVNGVLWSIVNKVGGQVLSLGVVLVLARLLTPEDFGLLAMVTVVTGFAMRFAELGLGAAIIHRPDLNDDHLASAFWINTGIGALLTAIVAAAAPLIAGFYEEPYLLWITLVTSANFIIRSLGIVQDALLRKTINFKRIALVNIVSSGVAGAVAVVAALMGSGGVEPRHPVRVGREHFDLRCCGCGVRGGPAFGSGGTRRKKFSRLEPASLARWR